jgi:hypothetical protein
VSGERRDPHLRAFVSRVFGPRGSLRLHRAAIGFDLLKAPFNVVMAPLFLLSRIGAKLAGWLRMPGLSAWLGRRKIFFETAVAHEVAQEVRGLAAVLRAAGYSRATPEAAEEAIRDYVATRSAVAEMVTTLFVVVVGALIFQAPTPGMISLASPLAEMRAQADAVAGFPLGSGLGRLYYGVFPVSLPVWQVVLTGVVLAVFGALVTTFAGILADPLQVLTGTHRRRLARMFDRLDRDENTGVAREHLMARFGDLSDLALSLYRGIRG